MSLTAGEDPMLLTQMKIQEYLDKCSRGEETVEDAQAIVNYLREVRGKAKADPPSPRARAKTATTPGKSVNELLEGL